MLFLLRHAAGFLLQLLPCLFLCIQPFGEDKFIRSRRCVLTVTIAVLSAVSVVFSVLIQNVQGHTHGIWNVDVLSNLCMFTVVAVCFIAFSAVVREHAAKKLISLCLAFNYGIIVYMCLNIANCLLPNNWFQPFTEIYNPGNLLTLAIITAITYPLACLAMKKIIRRHLSEINPTSLRQTLCLVLASTLLYILFICSIIPGLQQDNSRTRPLYLEFSGAFVFCTIFLLVIYWFLFWEVRVIQERMQLKNQLQIQQLQYQKIIGDVENTRRMRHDMRHHFHLLERLLNEEQYAEAKAYLQATADSSDTAGMRSFCNDPMINALLQYYADECDNHGIRFEVKAEITQCFAALNDMTVLLGNCLENAVLSCRQLPGERVIRLKIGQVNSTLAILLENSCGHIQLAPSIKQTDGYLPASAFLSEQGEGLGLGSIEHTAKKYDGAAEFRYSPPLFYTRISLEQPNPSP